MDYESKQVYKQTAWIGSHLCICAFWQQKKCSRTTQKSMEDPQKWMEQFAQLKEYSTKFAKITGEQMLQLKDDELINVFAMDSAVDRLYASYHLFATRPFVLDL